MSFLKKIVVTGIGPVAATGIGKVDFWNGILRCSSKAELIKVIVGDEVWGEYYRYGIKDFSSALVGIHEDRLSEIKEWKQGELDEDFLYLLAAIKLALEDSGLCYQGELAGTSLVLAHENLGLMPVGIKLSDIAYKLLTDNSATKLSKRDFFERFYRIFLKKGYDVQSFANLFHITKLFGISNYSLFINNACASGLYALEVASQIIHSGLAKRVVIACSDYSDIYKFLWFKELGIYSLDGIVSPFSSNSSGLVFGDGGAAIVLEDFEDAKRRKAPIYAEYLNGGFDLENWKITLPDLTSDSYQRAIKMCLNRSKIKIADIDFLCPHGVGAKAIDYYEARAIENVFGPYPNRPLISAFKPYFGHNLGGSALLETLVLLLILQENVIPPTLNSSIIQSRIKFSLVDSLVDVEIKVAMKTCCAFAGYNAAVLFKKI